jgi:hypothetical protein
MMQLRNKAIPIIGLLLCLSVIYIYNLVPLVLSWGPSANYRNASVRTTVNITQAYPEIINVTCNNGTAITLNPGTTKTASCLVQIRDYNGGNNINSTNGTFYYYLNNSIDPDDNNTHYTNATCINETPNGYYVNWTCSFDLWYYANNGTWKANITVKDNYNMSVSGSRNATINPLYALNVTQEINFGNMAVGDITGDPPVQANITNFGNRDINITVYGFGGEDPGTGAGLAMNCTVRNISISNERYDLSLATQYPSMTPITSSATNITGLKVYQQTNDSQQVINSTYWRLNVNLTNNPFGQCNGTVVFSAEIG